MKEKTLTKEEIFKQIKRHRKTLERYGVKKIGVFGSYVRGEQKKDSDIDLAIEFDRKMFGKNFEGLFDAFVDLSSFLERLFDRKVDILTPDSIRTIRIKEVAEEIERGIVYV